jgi:hypothetical protein
MSVSNGFLVEVSIEGFDSSYFNFDTIEQAAQKVFNNIWTGLKTETMIEHFEKYQENDYFVFWCNDTVSYVKIVKL